MAGISNYMENRLLNSLRNVSAAVAAVYVKLHIGDPGETCTSNPAAETDRVLVTFAAPAGDGSIENDIDVLWTGVSTTEVYSHISLWDASTAGNALWKGALDVARSVTAGDDFKIVAGDLIVSLD
jgi:hypothetical protein